MIQGNTIASTAMQNGVWVDGDIATNPSNADILATTGAMREGDYLFSFMLHATADATVTIAKRNAADGSDLHSKDIPLPANNLIEPIIATKLTLANSERVIVRQKGNLTGNVEASIFYSKIVG